MTIAVLGAGAFGTALAVALARGGQRVGLWGRNPAEVAQMAHDRENAHRLPGVAFPESVSVSAEIADFAGTDTLLLAVPMQALSGFVAGHRAALAGRKLVACAKGIDLASGRGPTAILREAFPGSHPAILTGPSFAADIARGLPTALTLACADDPTGFDLLNSLSTPVLRLYLTNDTAGAELGGALKNVMAIAAGVVIGAGLGESARAALMTRGFAEMMRLALKFGARPETLGGLSGLGDLILTCTSDQSRNFRFGRALGRGEPFDATVTVEGVATARATARLAAERGVDMPVARMVAALVDQRITVNEAVAELMARPLKKE
ncbi:MAG: NAD(P)H-dependent glycerol-3-phosphate dehydrogenase [Paracoccaceae bacterium]